MATTFPRDVVPSGSSWLTNPGPLLSWGETGKGQGGVTGQMGRAWTETYEPIKAADAAVQRFLARVAYYWGNCIVLDVAHWSKQARLGAGGGTPKVNGASQTGNVIHTDGWPNNTLVLKGGDLIRLGTLLPVFEVVEDATTNGSGQVDLTVNPGIIAGGSPADNGDIATNPGILFRCLIAAEPNWPDCPPDEFYVGFRITFRECLF